MINTIVSSVSQDFDALQYELGRFELFRVSQKRYIESKYEIDSESDEFGELYRVWLGRTLLGTFYVNSLGQWTANPYYQNRQYIRLDKDLSRTFSNNSLAIRHITRSYSGKV